MSSSLQLALQHRVDEYIDGYMGLRVQIHSIMISLSSITSQRVYHIEFTVHQLGMAERHQFAIMPAEYQNIEEMAFNRIRSILLSPQSDTLQSTIHDHPVRAPLPSSGAEKDSLIRLLNHLSEVNGGQNQLKRFLGIVIGHYLNGPNPCFTVKIFTSCMTGTEGLEIRNELTKETFLFRTITELFSWAEKVHSESIAKSRIESYCEDTRHIEL